MTLNPVNESPPGERTSRASFGAVVSGSFVRSVLLVLQGLIVSRFLGPEGYGKFSLALAFVGLVFGVVDFRVQHAVIKFMAEAEGRPVLYRQLLGLFFMAFEALKGILGFAISVALGYVYLIYFQKELTLFPLLVALATYSLAMTANPTLTAFLRLAGRFRAIALYDSIFGIVSLFLVGTTAAVFRQPVAVGKAYLLVGLLAGLSKASLAWTLLNPTLTTRGLGPALHGWRDAHIPWRTITRFVLGVNLATTCRIVARNLDVVILARFVPLEAVGWYSLAKRIKDLFSYLTDPLLIILYPEFARAWTERRLGWLRSTIRRTILWSTSLATLAFTALALAAAHLVPLAFGQAFSATSSLLWFFILDAVANAGFFAVPHLVMAMGSAGDIFRGALLRLLLVATLGPALAAIWGGAGLAVAVGVATTMNMLVLIRSSARALSLETDPLA